MILIKGAPDKTDSNFLLLKMSNKLFLKRTLLNYLLQGVQFFCQKITFSIDVPQENFITYYVSISYHVLYQFG